MSGLKVRLTPWATAFAVMALAACAPALPVAPLALQDVGAGWTPASASIRTVGLGLPGGAYLGDGVTFAGGVELVLAPASPLHSLSDLKLIDDAGFISVSDAGDLVRGRLVLDRRGRLVGVEGLRHRRLTLRDGSPIVNKADGDAESLALIDNGDLLISFERDHRIWNYGSPDALAMRPAPVRRPDVDFPLNDGMEGVSARPGGWRVAGESDGVWDCSSTRCDVVVAPSETPLADSDFRITGMDRDPAGAGFFVVQRSYRRPIDVRANVRRLDENGVLGPILVALSLPGTTDNFEGIAAVTQGDATRLYILSDDNNNRHQRTLLLAFNVSR